MLQYPLDQIAYDDLKHLAAGVVETYCYRGLAPFNRVAAIEYERQELWQLVEGEDSDSLAELRQSLNIPDSYTDNDLKTQVFKYPDGRLLAAGIYRNHNEESRIEIHSSFALTVKDIDQLTGYLSSVFSWAKASYLVCWPAIRSSTANTLLSRPGVFAAESFYAANLSDIPTEIPKPITLRPFEMEQDWPWYQEQHQRLFQANPQIPNLLPISERSEIASAVALRQCSIAQYQGIDIGLIKAEPSRELGLTGLMITEAFIIPEYWGQGLASSMQRLFLQTKAKGCDLISAYIDAGNIPSREHAEQQNCQLRRQEIYIHLPT